MKSIPSPIKLTGVLLLAAVAGAQAQPKTASLAAECRSVALAQSSGVWPGYGTVYNSFTTFDGQAGIPLHDQVNGSWIFGEEVRPRVDQPGVYEADFVTFNSVGSYIEYGSLTLNAPTTDSDANGLPDLCQKNKSVNASISGSGIMDWSYVGLTGMFTISGTLSRSANSLTGNYLMTVGDVLGSVTYSGSWGLVYVSGSVSYEREPANRLNFNLQMQCPDGASRTLTGSTTFSVNNANQLALPQFSLTNSDGRVLTLYPLVLNRTGNKYVGDLQILDGNTATSWPDYTAWAIEVTDPNDSNANGVPDLSDLGLAPSIITQPRSLTVGLGQDASFSVQAAGTPPLTYLWQFNTVNLLVGTNATMLVRNAQTADAGDYRVIVTNLAGSVTSALATLTVALPPLITVQPQSQTVSQGGSVTLTVAASGSTPISYQWRFNGTNLNGATATSLTRANFQRADEGPYDVVLSNAAGIKTSDQAWLYLNQPLRFINWTVAGDGVFYARLLGVAGSNYVVLASTDLTAWTPLLTNQAMNGITDFADTNWAGYGKKFYRAR